MYSNSINVIPPMVITLLSFYGWGAAILGLIGMAKLFMKAGEKWWKIFIPIYNDYIFYKIIKGVNLFIAKIICIILYILGLIVVSIGVNLVLSEQVRRMQLLPFAIIGLWALIFIIVLIVIEILTAKKLSRAFGKKGWYTVGYFFFPYIFLLIYAFGNYEYQYKIDEYGNVVDK